MIEEIELVLTIIIGAILGWVTEPLIKRWLTKLKRSM